MQSPQICRWGFPREHSSHYHISPACIWRLRWWRIFSSINAPWGALALSASCHQGGEDHSHWYLPCYLRRPTEHLSNMVYSQPHHGLGHECFSIARRKASTIHFTATSRKATCSWKKASKPKHATGLIVAHRNDPHPRKFRGWTVLYRHHIPLTGSELGSRSAQSRVLLY